MNLMSTPNQKLQLARIAFEIEDYEKAKLLFQQALEEIEEKELRSEIYIELAHCEFESSFQKCSKLFQKAKLENPNSPNPNLQKGLFFQYLKNNLQRAQNEFEIGLEKDAGNSALKEKLLKVYIEKAVENRYFRFCEKINSELNSLVFRNQISSAENDFIKFFRNLAFSELESEKQALQEEFAILSIQGDTDFNEQELEIKKILEEIANEPKKWELKLKLGKIYFETCNLEFACAVLEEAHLLAPQNEEINSYLIELYLPPPEKRIGIIRNLPIPTKKEGILRFEKILKMPNCPENLHLRFGLYFVRKNWLSLAQKTYESIPEEKKDAEIYYALGNLYLKLYQRHGKDTLENAIQNYEKAKKHNYSNFDDIEMHLSECFHLKRMKEELAFSRLQMMNLPGILVGKSKGISLLKNKIANLTHSNKAILLVGELGSGKRLVSQLIHDSSIRHDKQLIEIDALKFTFALVETNTAENNEPNFSVSIRNQTEFIKLLEKANKTTLLIRNINRLPRELQEILVSIIENGKISHATGIKKLDINLIATTYTYQTLLSDKNFSEDLLDLFSDSILEVPSLKDRKEDLGVLVDYFLAFYSEKHKKNRLEISDTAFKYLEKYNFKENIRELSALIENTISQTQGRIIKTFEDETQHFEPARKVLRSSQKIIEALEQADGNISKAAEILGCDRSGLHRKLKKFNIDPKNFKKVV
ncbi:sigma-54-dependent Fis family transcriptional regulator [bacterium]|nr:sigma-54-dependent Fis family transcriptional regulator [bacterium]